MTTLGLIVLAECGTFLVATTVFIYLKQLISNKCLKNIERSTEKYKVFVHYYLTIYAPMIYMAPCIMLLMWAASITLAGGRGLSFLGPKWHSPFGLMPYHRA
jgi:hypothetical protein